jgi:methyl-accepting chemotaxis protein
MHVIQESPVIGSEADLALILTAMRALKKGDGNARLPTEWQGLPGKIATEFNELAAQSAQLANGIKAIDRRSGRSNGKSPARLPITKMDGFWRDSADSINSISEHSEWLQGNFRRLRAALTSLKKGDLSVRLIEDDSGLPTTIGQTFHTFNEVVEQNLRMTEELAWLSRVVGKEGKLKERASLPVASGFWRDSVESINSLIDDLVHPTSEVARVIGAVAQGDLSKSMALEADDRALEGEFLRTAKIINKMVEQLGTFAAEVTRVAREVGTDGKLGGQAEVQGVAGTWKDMTDSVN